jgi:hypothetical protein
MSPKELSPTIMKMTHPLATRPYEEYVTEAMLLGMHYAWISHTYQRLGGDLAKFDAENPTVEVNGTQITYRISRLVGALKKEFGTDGQSIEIHTR